MIIEKFEIAFNRPDGVYFAGEDVSGRVIFELKEDTKINELLLEVKGGSKTYWTKHSGNSRKHYSDSENYFCEQFNTKYTWGFGKLHERVLLQGKHEVPFAVTLLKTIPSSFEGEFGHIRYTCKATLERPWDSDILCKRAFTIIGLEDINDSKDAEKPIDIYETISLGRRFCFTSLGTFFASLTSSKSGFVSGESVDSLCVTVKNDSSKTLKCCRLKLKQIVQFIAKDFSGNCANKELVKDVLKLENGPVEPHQNFVWDKNFFKIPALISSLSSSRIIKIHYELELEIVGYLIMTVPLVLGAIPLLPENLQCNLAKLKAARKDKMSVVREEEEDEGKTKEGNTEKASHEIRDILENSKTFTPTFRDNFFGPADISDSKEQIQFGETSFTPKYPCYDSLEQI